MCFSSNTQSKNLTRSDYCVQMTKAVAKNATSMSLQHRKLEFAAGA
jgi:hypothetical protein